MRLRFTIRDLLWLTALVAMGVGWWLDHRQLSDAEWEVIGQYCESNGFADPVVTPKEAAAVKLPGPQS